MGDKSIIIIGAGMGGLAAGIYGRMKGYDTHDLGAVHGEGPWFAGVNHFIAPFRPCRLA